MKENTEWEEMLDAEKDKKYIFIKQMIIEN